MAANVWKGHLTFGLVSLPIKLFVAARSESLTFNQIHKHDHSRVKQVLYCAAEDKPIPKEEIVKGFEYEKGKFIVIDDQDLEKAQPETFTSMEILEFVKSSDVDPVFLESSYFAIPDTAGEKAYALLFQAMRLTGMIGIAKVAMHNREHIVILRPGEKGILLHTMFYRHEVRELAEFRTDTTVVSEQELGLAKMLIESLSAGFEPQKYSDQYRENVLALITNKVNGVAGDPKTSPRPLAPVIDILDALRKSVTSQSPKQLPATAEQKQEKRGRRRVMKMSSTRRPANRKKVASGSKGTPRGGASAQSA